MLRIAGIIQDRVKQYGERASCVGNGGPLEL
jgi:monofunctional biosynthetic peptidoglycan transglycosylase